MNNVAEIGVGTEHSPKFPVIIIQFEELVTVFYKSFFVMRASGLLCRCGLSFGLFWGEISIASSPKDGDRAQTHLNLCRSYKSLSPVTVKLRTIVHVLPFSFK